MQNDILSTVSPDNEFCPNLRIWLVYGLPSGKMAFYEKENGLPDCTGYQILKNNDIDLERYNGFHCKENG